jgi:hypothetical protein
MKHHVLMTSQMLHRGITSGCGGSRQLTDFHQLTTLATTWAA